MKKTIDRMLAVVALLAVCTFAVACDEFASFRSVDNNPGSFDSDFVGNGGSVVETFTWTNNATRAEYSMDITAENGGSVSVVLRDADGTEVAQFSLDTNSPDDSLDGLSNVGTPGEWTIEVLVQDFSGDGSLSVGAEGR